jgi:hypothetical protein
VLFCLGCENCRFVVCGSFALLEGDSARGARGQTVAKSIAIILASKMRLAVKHFYCALMTGIGARAAAIAFFFVDFDDFPDHDIPLLALVDL